jgi:hypothetical protein
MSQVCLFVYDAAGVKADCKEVSAYESWVLSIHTDADWLSLHFTDRAELDLFIAKLNEARTRTTLTDERQMEMLADAADARASVDRDVPVTVVS